MALFDHIRLQCLINGQLQTEMSNIQVNGDSGAQAVETLRGLAGKTDGGGRLEINGNAAVPTGGPQFDFWGTLVKRQYVEMQIPIGAKTIISKGWFQTVGISQSTNANTEQSFHFVGELEAPK